MVATIGVSIKPYLTRTRTIQLGLPESKLIAALDKATNATNQTPYEMARFLSIAIGIHVMYVRPDFVTREMKRVRFDDAMNIANYVDITLLNEATNSNLRHILDRNKVYLLYYHHVNHDIFIDDIGWVKTADEYYVPSSTKTKQSARLKSKQLDVNLLTTEMMKSGMIEYTIPGEFGDPTVKTANHFHVLKPKTSKTIENCMKYLDTTLSPFLSPMSSSIVPLETSIICEESEGQDKEISQITLEQSQVEDTPKLDEEEYEFDYSDLE